MKPSNQHRILFALRLAVLLAVAVASLGALPAQAAAEEPPVVRAVLFFSPTCGHCHKVMTETLPPLLDQYGDQLVILSIDITKQAGASLYQAATVALNIPNTRRGVPTLVVGENVLVGSSEIPNQFPGLIETYLKAGGSQWPLIPGLEDVLATLESAAPTALPTPEISLTAALTATPLASPAPTLVPTITPTPTPLPLDISANFKQDQSGNLLAVIVLIGMIATVSLAAVPAMRPTLVRMGWRVWLIPLLALAGMGISFYLAYVESTHTLAVCGPVGDCNTVQQSEYAQIGGIPVGIVGLAGYVAILLAWGAGILKSKAAEWAALALLAMTFGGTLFSIYLTYLEPFVIGATCLWCLASAVVMTLLFVLSIPYYWSRRYPESD